MVTQEVREVVVVDAIRLPVGKSSRAQMSKYGGYYRNVSSQDMLAGVLESLVDRVQQNSTSFDAAEIEDVHVGVLTQIGDQGGNIARVATLMAKNIPDIVASATVNRYCNAGLPCSPLPFHSHSTLSSEKSAAVFIFRHSSPAPSLNFNTRQRRRACNRAPSSKNDRVDIP